MSDGGQTGDKVRQQWMIALLGTLAAIAILASLYLASTVLAPVACAFFIIALAWPAQAALQARMPQLLALAIVVGTVVVVFVVFASIVAWGFGRVGRYLIADAARFQAIYEQVTLWLEGHGIAVNGIWTEHFNVGWMVRAVQHVTGRVNTTVSFWLVVLVYVILGLLEVGPIARKVRTLLSPATVRVLIDGSVETAAKFRRYMVIRTIMSLATGIFVWALAAASGLELATEWGVIAFVLNYIPFIGPFIATVFPALFALAQFASWQSALVVFVGLNVIQFVIGSYVEPRVSGSALAISPFVVLFAVFFWAYFWGLFGAFIGVPIMIALLTYCAQHPASRWVADLFGDPDAQPQA
jgi:predicted PurR-regulated permease PerM